MISPIFKPEWRTQNRFKRRIYTKYMTWLERGGYLAVAIILALFVGSFVYRVDDYVTAQAVPITPNTTKFTADDSTLVVRIIPADFAEVKKGDPLIEIVKGDDAIRKFQLWQAVEAAKQSGDKSFAAIPSTKPQLTTIIATEDGTFRMDSKPGTTLAKKDLIGRLVHYDNLEAIGSFKGDTVPAAKDADVATISGISVDTGNDTILRATSPIGAMLSRSLAGDSVKSALGSSLTGTKVKLRDDVPLEIKSISGVEVDAVVQGKSAASSSLVLDPPANMKLQGTVIHGEHMAEVQFAELPKEVRAAADEALSKAVAGQNVAQPNGSSFDISSISDAKYVVKAKAKISDSQSKGGISASSLSRTFDATIKIDSPPPYLIAKVRLADKLGKAVTAKVEVKTGTRPIAFILLRRS